MKRLNIKKRNNFFILLTLAITAFVAFLCINLHGRYNVSVDADVFIFSNKINISKNENNPYGEDERTGILLTAIGNGASVQIGEQMSGMFSTEFIPYSAQTGNCDFSNLTFTFKSEESRMGFYVKFMPDSKGSLMVFGLSCTDKGTVVTVTDSSFCNLSKKTFNFSFDPNSMSILDGKNTVFASMQNENFMREFLTDNTLCSWEKYSVSISFDGIKDNMTAKVLFYSINNQNLGGVEIKNNVGPVIVTLPSVNKGVVNKPYTIDAQNIITYDFLDGYKTGFVGEIEILDNENKFIDVINNQFVPSSSGIYTINYIPIDSDGVYGEKRVVNFNVLARVPNVEFCYELPIEENEIGAGSSVYLPKAVAKSELSDDGYSVFVKLLKGGAEVKVNSIATGEFVRINEIGNYTVVYNCLDSIGEYFEESFNIVVSDIPFINDINIDKTYSIGEKFNVPVVVFKKGSLNFAAQNTIIFPNGNRSQSDSINIAQNGTYTLLYEFNYNEHLYKREFYFNAVKNADVLFSSADGLTVTANYDAPNYADNSYNGTLLTARQSVSTEFVNIIDISDNTENDILIEFFVAPKEASSMEFDQLDIYFYDIYDENNFIHIRFVDDIWFYYEYAMCAIGITTDEFDAQTDANKRKYFYNNFVYSTFYGKETSKGIYPSQSVKLYFDYNSGKLFANVAAKENDLKVAKLSASRVIADLSDESWVGAGNAFKGFHTGEAKMVVKMSGLKTAESNLMILNVDGQNLSGRQLKDKTSPAIFVDYGDNNPKDLPLGIINEEYTIYDAYGWDVVDGYIENVESEVYYISDDALPKKVRISNNTFIPEQKGKYQIVYTVSDSCGNVSSKTVVITVVYKTDIPEISYSFSNKIKSYAMQGDIIRIYDGEATGGTGALHVNREVIYNGNQIELDENDSFRATRYGTYIIRVRVRDYNGEANPFEFVINVASLTEAFIYDRTINDVVRTGEEIIFPEFKAGKFIEYEEKDVEVQYYINGTELGHDRGWTPLVDGAYTLTVRAEEVEKNYTIYAVSDNNATERFSQSYFYSKSADMQLENTGIIFSTTDPNNCKISLARAIDQQFLSYSIRAESENFSLIKMVWTDSINPSERIETYIRKGISVDGTKNCAFFIINGEEKQMRNKFIGESVSLTIKYLPDKFMIVDDLNNVLSTIKYTADGNIFHGFSSGNIYLSFYVGESEEVSEESPIKFSISSITNQPFNRNVKSDRIGPIVKISGENGEIGLGGVIPIYSAIGFDLLSGLKSLTVTVKFNGQTLYNNVPCNETFNLVAEKYGTYSITYIATDKLGNTTKSSRGVSVIDRISPDIVMSEDMITNVKINGDYVLPRCSVSDNYSQVENIKFYVYYIAPNGKMDRINEYAFKPDQKGVYKIVYMAKDENGNTAIKTFSVQVQE